MKSISHSPAQLRIFVFGVKLTESEEIKFIDHILAICRTFLVFLTYRKNGKTFFLNIGMWGVNPEDLIG